MVCTIAARVVLKDANFYSFKAIKPKAGSKYQKGKFTSIFFVQMLGFFLIPYVILPLSRGGDFWNDALAPSAKNAHVYVYPGFQSWGMAVYLFGVIPAFVYFFGKRYCSWVCSCGNLAETVGVTVWGQKWVKEGTPRGEDANRNHWIQVAVMVFAFGFGALLLFDSLKVVAAPDWVAKVSEIQDLGSISCSAL